MKRIDKKLTALVQVNPRYFTEVINHVLWKKDRGGTNFPEALERPSEWGVRRRDKNKKPVDGEISEVE